MPIDKIQWDLVKLPSADNQALTEPVKSENAAYINISAESTSVNNIDQKNTLTSVAQSAFQSTLQSVVSSQPKITVQVKQWNKVWWTGLIIWCLSFFILFIWIVFAALFFAANNPQTLQSIGMTVDTVKTLLTIFAGLFFWILILWMLWLTTYNWYKSATIKEWSRAKNIFWLVVSFFFMLVFVWLAILSFTKIKDIQNTISWSTNVVTPYMEVKSIPGSNDPLNGKRSIFVPNTKIIWPVNIYYQVNNDVFTKLKESQVGQNATLNYIKLDCGNGQTLDNRNSPFDKNNLRIDPCFYTNKWDYNISLEYNYTALNWTTNSVTIAVGTLPVASDINLMWNSTKYTFNDKKSEIIVWASPIKVNVNAQKIFTDLGLTDVNITWDMDGNGSIDKTNRADFTQYYLNPKLYSIYYNIPWFDYTFVLKLRVNAWDVPPCAITNEILSDTDYRFMLNIDDNQTDISSYKFDIIDVSNDDIVKSVNSDKKLVEYSFEPWKSYKVRWFFTTAENKVWFCESPSLSIGNQWYKIFTSFFTKLPTEKDYQKIEMSWQNSANNSTIEISDLPTMLQFKIEKTIPQVSNPNYEVYLGKKLVNPSDQWVYTIRIEDAKSQKLQIKWLDDQQKEFYKNFDIIVKKKNVIANIKVDKAVWFDPLVVKLDASISKLNDPDDEIIYFTRDFGDGKSLNNISQWKITHQYEFDTTRESGEYYPKVTIKTKKWYTDIYTMVNPIVVKRQLRTAKIHINSNPGQLAKVWDVVNMSIETDGDIKSISRWFGNDKNMSCTDRSCIETNVTYDQPGYYDIVATIDYNDSPSNTQTVKIKIE